MSAQAEPSEIGLAGAPALGAAPELLNLRRRAVRGGAVVFGSRLVIQSLSWVVTIFVARFLRPYDYGVLTNGAILIGLADLLAEAGVGKALVQRENLQPEDLDEGFTLGLGLALLLYAGIFIVAGPSAAYFHTPELTAYLRVAGLLLVLIPFRAVPMAILERRLQLARQSGIQVAGSLLQAFLVLGLAIVGFGFWALLAGMMAARLLEAILVARQVDWSPRLRRPHSSSGLLKYGIHVSGGTFFWYLYSNSDFAVLGRLFGPVELGYYAFAFGMISLPVQKITSSFNQVAFPFFCRLQHEPVRLKGWYLRMTALLGLIGLPTMVGMALVGRDAIPLLLGAKWAPAVAPFEILSGAGAVMVLSASLSPLINALGRPDILLRYNLVCCLAYPASFVVAGRLYGVIGVASVWLILYPVLMGGLVVLTRRITGVGLLDVVAVQAPILYSVAVMTVCVLSAQWLLADLPQVLPRLAASVLIGVVVYGGAVWWLTRDTVLKDVKALARDLQQS